MTNLLAVRHESNGTFELRYTGFFGGRFARFAKKCSKFDIFGFHLLDSYSDNFLSFGSNFAKKYLDVGSERERAYTITLRKTPFFEAFWKILKRLRKKTRGQRLSEGSFVYVASNG